MLKNEFLEIKDFDCIGNIAKHCDFRKLDIAISHAFDFDLKPLLCGLFWEAKSKWGSEEEAWEKLINGSDFIGCNDVEMNHKGLKTVLAFYAYSRYLIDNRLDDTPNGAVQKTNDWSVPEPIKNIQLYSNKYRNMAVQTFKDVEAYLCLNRNEHFKRFNSKNCAPCGCNAVCGYEGHNDTRFFGLSGKNVTK